MLHYNPCPNPALRVDSGPVLRSLEEKNGVPTDASQKVAPAHCLLCDIGRQVA